MALIVERLLAADSANGLESPDFGHCREIRRLVFIEEQRVDEALEFDGLDADAQHFLAWQTELQPRLALGTARLRRLLPDEAPSHHVAWKAERVAVLQAHRRTGAGRALMEALEQCAAERGAETILLHAQVAVIPFYESLGYTAHGDVFVEADIEHREMEKALG